MRSVTLLIILLFFSVCPAQVLNERIVIDRLDGNITLDGELNESAWQKTEVLELLMYLPEFDLPPSEDSEIRMLHDDEYIYVGGRFYDSEPDKIQVASLKRDYMELRSDVFGIILDSFSDKENALAFFTSSAGTRTDAAVFDDANGDFPLNENWNSYWSTATKVDSSGWVAEMRIPLSSLRYQVDDGEAVMGVILWRWIARKNESGIYPAISPKWGWWGQFKPSQARQIVIKDITQKNPLYVAPYALGGLSVDNELNDPETAYEESRTRQSDVGLDVKYGLTSNLTLDLTVNTDFAQVEADNQQINLTRSSLFFPEKRLFFLERSSIFDFRMGGIDRLFYSRRIGLDDSRPVPIIGGARLSGRVGPWDVGLLNMQTAESDGLPSENFGLVRLRRQLGNGNSYVGGMVTNRMSAGGRFNTAVGSDAIFNLWDDEYLFLAAAQTYDNEIENNPLFVNKSRIHASWQRRRYQNLSYEFAYSYSGREYTPGMGFASRDNYKRFAEEMGYGWIPQKYDWIQRHRVYFNNTFYWRNSDEKLESMQNMAGWEASLRSGSYFNLAFINNRELLEDSLEFSDNVAVPPGRYDFPEVAFYYETPGGNLWWVSSEISASRFYDGDRFSFIIAPSWSLTSQLEMSGYWSYNRLRFEDRGQTLDANIYRLRGLYFFNAKLSLSAFVQYNNVRDIVIGNARLRFNPSEGHDLYIVYNEDYNTDRRREVPVLPHSNNRTILVKYTYTFLF